MFRDGLRINGVDAKVSGTFTAGNVLAFDGTNIIAGTAGTGNGTSVTTRTGFGTINFGTTPAFEASATVAATWVTASHNISVWIPGAFATATNGYDEHEDAAANIAIFYSSSTAGVSFTVKAISRWAYVTGSFHFEWLAQAP